MLNQIILAIVFAAQAGSTVSKNDLQDGQIITYKPTTASVWNAQTKTASSIEVFWQSYALRSGGKYWGRNSEYPPYEEVNEQDTFLVELDSGVCLMEFFHSRWRRANAVRRWDERYDEYSGCPSVFD